MHIENYIRYIYHNKVIYNFRTFKKKVIKKKGKRKSNTISKLSYAREN